MKCNWKNTGVFLLSAMLLTAQTPAMAMADEPVIIEEGGTCITEESSGQSAIVYAEDHNPVEQLGNPASVDYADNTILEVMFDDNSNYRAMENAINDAKDKIPNTNTTTITTIRLTGTATEITGDNWETLRNMYLQSNRFYPNLSTLDLSGLTSLIKLADGTHRASSNNNLKEVIFPSNLVTIGGDAFKSCDMLTSLSLPSALKNVEKNAFRGCSSLTQLDFPNSLEKIGESAFQECLLLDNLSFNENLTDIGLTAFAFCSSLQTVTLPKTLHNIGKYAFQNCSALTSISVNPDNQSFSAIDGVLYNKDMTTLLFYPPGKDNSTFTLPNTVNKIYDSAISECNNLNSLILSENLTDIGYYGIKKCANLSSIMVDNNPNFTSNDGVLYNKDQTTLLLYPPAKTGASFTVPDSVKTIGMAAFQRCLGLNAIILPESVSKFDDYAFSYCNNLNSITFSGNHPPSETFPGYSNAFTGVSASGTLSYPAGAGTSYTEQWKNALKLSNWSLVPAYRLEVEYGTDVTNSVLYKDGTSVEIKAATPPAGQRFYKWTSVGGGSFTDASREHTTFTMPASNAKVTATYINIPHPHVHSFGKDWLFDETHHWKTCTANDGAQSEYGAHTYDNWTTDNGTGSNTRKCTTCGYIQTETPDHNTLTDTDTGIQINGCFTSDAVLSIKKAILHEEGTCPVCDEIRARQDAGELIALYDISLSSGTYNGEVEISFPVDKKYNGQPLILLHCMDRKEDRQEAEGKDGFVTGTFKSLSPFAVLDTTKVTSIKLAPSSLTLELGKSKQIQTTVTPENAHNKKVTWKSSNKKVATVSTTGQVKAVKAGTATITCTAADGSGAKATCKITVKNTSTPILIMKGTAGKNSIRLNWNQISNADGYEIYGSRCGERYSYKKIKTIKNNATKTWTQSKLRTATAYKYYIKAYKLVNGKKLYLRTSKTAHVVTTGGSYTNVKAVNTSFTDITLVKGKSQQITARVIPVKKGAKLANHVPEFRYKTTNSKVTTVTDSGKIRAVGKGKCSVYVYANNGVTRRIQITVK